MKTVLAVMLLVVAVSLCHAQETKKTEYAVSVDTSKVNLGQQVDQVADALKKHLDGPLGMYYQMAVRRNHLMGLLGTAFLLVFIVTFCSALLQITILLRRKADPTGAGLVAVVSGILLLCLMPLWVGSIEMCICPEYVALNNIITKIGAIVQ